MAHSHAHHGDDDDLDIPVRIRRLLALLIVPVLVATGVGLLVLRPQGPGPDLRGLFGQSTALVKGNVVGTTTETCLGSPADSPDRCQEVTVRLDQGKDQGRRVKLEMGGSAGSPAVHVDDKVLLGADTTDGTTTYYFSDFNRDFPIALLFLLFVAASVVFGRWSGVRALAALVISLLVLVWFVIPSVLHGHSPIIVAIVGSSFIMLAVLYVTGGFNTQSTVAVLGTLLSLALIAGLAWVFVIGSKLTGLADEDAVFLSAAGGSINLQGLLLGGIVIGSLGVLDDMTVTQVSAVWELRKANPRYDVRSLYRAAERIGRDHIASTVNTLVLAYAGASLPLLIFFTQSNLQLRNILTSEVIAVEVVRTLVGSIGLIASVPITTALAAFVVTRSADEPAQSGSLNR
ncbi:MAG: YibE/F family protein [Acidimicrobiales bacterium]|nr:YibE/F family protein [Acidimicrobiales bacterium]